MIHNGLDERKRNDESESSSPDMAVSVPDGAIWRPASDQIVAARREHSWVDVLLKIKGRFLQL